MDLSRRGPKKWEGGRDYMLPAAKFSILSYHTIMVVQLTTPFIHTVAMVHPDKIAKGIRSATLDKGTKF